MADKPNETKRDRAGQALLTLIGEMEAETLEVVYCFDPDDDDEDGLDFAVYAYRATLTRKEADHGQS